EEMIAMYLPCFFEAEDGIRDRNVTVVQTCALPILVARGFWWVVRGFWWAVRGFWWVVRAKNGLRTAGATYTPAPGLWSPFSPHGLDGSGGFGGPDGLDTRDGRARRARCATGGEAGQSRTSPARRSTCR